MGCVLLGIALFLPRVALFLLFVFTGWIGRAFDGWVIPVLGFLLMPYSTAWYTYVMNRHPGDWGFWQVLFMVLAVLMDLSSHGWFARSRRKD